MPQKVSPETLLASARGRNPHADPRYFLSSGDGVGGV